MFAKLKYNVQVKDFSLLVMHLLSYHDRLQQILIKNQLIKRWEDDAFSSSKMFFEDKVQDDYNTCNFQKMNWVRDNPFIVEMRVD